MPFLRPSKLFPAVLNRSGGSKAARMASSKTFFTPICSEAPSWRQITVFSKTQSHKIQIYFIVVLMQHAQT